MHKLYFSIALIMLWSIQLTQSQTIIVPESTPGIHNSQKLHFQLPESEFHSLKLMLEFQFAESKKISDGTFLSLQLKNQNSESPEFVEFGRIYLPSTMPNNLSPGLEYLVDLELWQSWLRKDKNIYLVPSDSDLSFKVNARLSAEEGPAGFAIKAIIPLWQSNLEGFKYGKEGISSADLPSKQLNIPQGTNAAFISVLVSGNQSAPQSSGRFYFLKLNDEEIARRSIWRDDCGLNPIFPQHDGWFVERPNWCPGLQVHPIRHFFDKTQLAKNDLKLDLVFQSDLNQTSGIDAFVVSSVLFALQVDEQEPQIAISEILAPNTNIWHQRYNPICGTPVILIQNRGMEPIEEITFNYGYNFQTDNKFRWNGELGFLEEEIIYLPSINWYFYENDDEPENFTVHVSTVNGLEKAFSGAKKTSQMALADVFPYKLKFDIITDHNGYQNGLEIFNDNGDPFFISGDLKPDTMYQFQLNFVPGCYEMIFYDLDGNGVKLNNNLPVLRILDQKKNTELKRFEPDFGTEIREQFMIFR